jgi:hypothetical protein
MSEPDNLHMEVVRDLHIDVTKNISIENLGNLYVDSADSIGNLQTGHSDATDLIKDVRKKALLLQHKIAQSKAIIYSYGKTPEFVGRNKDRKSESLRFFSTQRGLPVLLQSAAASLLLVALTAVFSKTPWTYVPLFYKVFPIAGVVFLAIDGVMEERKMQLLAPLVHEIELAEEQLVQLNMVIEDLYESQQ